jgi:predicted permease
MSLWSRVANLFRSGRVQRDLDDELQFHLEERTRALIAAGMPPESAAREAARRFGSPLRLREESLDVKLLPSIESLGRDVRLAVRVLRKNAIVTGAAVASLSLALGACVAAFALVDALILRPLPVHQPDRLVYLAYPTYTPERPESETFNDPVFVHLRQAARRHVDLFAMSWQVIRPVIFHGGAGDKERLRTQHVSGDAFGQLGVSPFIGRLLGASDDLQPGAHPAAVISHAFWLRRFGGDPAAVGRWFSVEDRQFQIVGVTPPRFTGVEPGRPTDVWLPYAMYNPRAFGNFQFNWFRVFGRLREGVEVEAAAGVLQAAFTNVRRGRVYLDGPGPARSPESVARFLGTPMYVRSAANGPSPLRGQFERPMWILGCIAALVLLIAGSNVANLFLARAAAREREMALRLSIGAGRSRLIQQMLVESALVAIAVCVLGLLVAAVAAPSVVSMLAPAEDPVRLDLRLDWRLCAFVGGLVVLTTALLGLAPALRASGVAPLAALKTGGERSGPRPGVMRPFVALQVAFGLVVLFVGSLLVQSFARLSSVSPGFATSDVLLLNVETVQRVEPDQQRAALLQVLDRLRTIPGVQAVSSAEFNALGRAWTHNTRLPGGGQQAVESTIQPVTAGYFETMRIPLLAGRTFERRDMQVKDAGVLVVNQSFAARYFGALPAVGRSVPTAFFQNDTGPYHVVGVVADTRYDLRKPAAPTIYVLMPLRNHGTIHARVAGDPAALASRLREEVRAADPLFRVTSVRTQNAAVTETMLRERLLALLSGFFALIGLVLAAVGLYGVLSYSVVQRTREIGIRVALGSRPRGVAWLVLADTGGTALVGAACGLAAALYLSRYVEALLFEVKPLEFWSLALPLGTLLMTATLAAALPALRAARVDPAIALRYE